MGSATLGAISWPKTGSLRVFLRWYHQAEAAAAAAGFRVYDHEKEIATELSTESLTVNPIDGHPSANLNRVYAKKLAAAIADSLRGREPLL